MQPTAPAAPASAAPASATARRLWPHLEAVHAITYFADEHRQAMAAAGCKGWWMGYFASRAAPMGAVGPAVVTAAFHGFAPAMVARALPDAWAFTGGPDVVLAARLEAVDAVLRRALGPVAEDPRTAAAAEALAVAAAAAPTAGRPLAAANQALPVPEEPHLRLWQACTTLREHRGDGHVLALVAEDLDGPTAHLLKVAQGGDAARLRQVRGLDEETWAAAAARARDRGLVDGGGALTAGGRDVVDRVEGMTDRLAATAYAHLDDGAVEQLVADLAPAVRAVVASGVIPYPNPIGVPAPAT